MEKCWCGHTKEEHLNSDGSCYECDKTAAVVCGADYCYKYVPYIPPIRSVDVKVLPTLEDRVRELEMKFERIVKVLERFQSSL
jgi:hypothetical protein